VRQGIEKIFRIFENRKKRLRAFDYSQYINRICRGYDSRMSGSGFRDLPISAKPLAKTDVESRTNLLEHLAKG
jgi:hypothetical protein